MNLYPDDADGDALKRVADYGSDMSQPMKIDFCVASPNESSGQGILEAVTAKGYDATLEQDADGTWTCYCAKHMVPTYHAIVECQEELEDVSKPFGGYADGWGTLGNGGK